MLSQEQADEFYVTLPSNASINFFENKTSSYLTKLCQPIHLTGNWVVGLSALTIPLSFYNIENEEELIIQMRDKNTLQYNIKFPQDIMILFNLFWEVFLQLYKSRKNIGKVKRSLFIIYLRKC